MDNVVGVADELAGQLRRFDLYGLSEHQWQMIDTARTSADAVYGKIYIQELSEHEQRELLPGHRAIRKQLGKVRVLRERLPTVERAAALALMARVNPTLNEDQRDRLSAPWRLLVAASAASRTGFPGVDRLS